MTLKHDGPGETATIVHRWDGGMTWMAHPDERMQRASHALAVDQAVWLVDPLDANGLDDELAGLGDVAGVVVLTNSHKRDADALADRYGVAVHVPACFDDSVDAFDAPVELFAEELAETGFEIAWEKAGSGWKEAALYHPDRRTLVVPDALMTSLFTKRDGQLEVFPFFQLSPPATDLGTLAVERILVGHGEPVFEDAQAALDAALDGSRRGAAAAILGRGIPTVARIAYHELRG